MKTNEMLRQIRALGFSYEKAANLVTVKNQNNYKLATINTNKKYQINTFLVGQEMLSSDEGEKLFIILTKFAHTSLSER